MDKSLYIYTSEKKKFGGTQLEKIIIKKIIGSHILKKNLNILDIGSGMGGLLEVLNSFGNCISS